MLTTVLESCDNWTVPVKGVLGGGHGSERYVIIFLVFYVLEP